MLRCILWEIESNNIRSRYLSLSYELSLVVKILTMHEIINGRPIMIKFQNYMINGQNAHPRTISDIIALL